MKGAIPNSQITAAPRQGAAAHPGLFTEIPFGQMKGNAESGWQGGGHTKDQ